MEKYEALEEFMNSISQTEKIKIIYFDEHGGERKLKVPFSFPIEIKEYLLFTETPYRFFLYGTVNLSHLEDINLPQKQKLSFRLFKNVTINENEKFVMNLEYDPREPNEFGIFRIPFPSYTDGKFQANKFSDSLSFMIRTLRLKERVCVYPIKYKHILFQTHDLELYPPINREKIIKDYQIKGWSEANENSELCLLAEDNEGNDFFIFRYSEMNKPSILAVTFIDPGDYQPLFHELDSASCNENGYYFVPEKGLLTKGAKN